MTEDDGINRFPPPVWTAEDLALELELKRSFWAGSRPYQEFFLIADPAIDWIDPLPEDWAVKLPDRPGMAPGVWPARAGPRFDNPGVRAKRQPDGSVLVGTQYTARHAFVSQVGLERTDALVRRWFDDWRAGQEHLRQWLQTDLDFEVMREFSLWTLTYDEGYGDPDSPKLRDLCNRLKFPADMDIRRNESFALWDAPEMVWRLRERDPRDPAIVAAFRNATTVMEERSPPVRDHRASFSFKPLAAVPQGRVWHCIVETALSLPMDDPEFWCALELLYADYGRWFPDLLLVEGRKNFHRWVPLTLNRGTSWMLPFAGATVLEQLDPHHVLSAVRPNLPLPVVGEDPVRIAGGLSLLVNGAWTHDAISLSAAFDPAGEPLPEDTWIQGIRVTCWEGCQAELPFSTPVRKGSNKPRDIGMVSYDVSGLACPCDPGKLLDSLHFYCKRVCRDRASMIPDMVNIFLEPSPR